MKGIIYKTRDNSFVVTIPKLLMRPHLNVVMLSLQLASDIPDDDSSLHIHPSNIMFTRHCNFCV